MDTFDYKSVHPIDDKKRVSESELIPYFKSKIESYGYVITKENGRSLTDKDWKNIYRASTDTITHFLSLGYSINIYRFGSFFWTYLGVRSIQQGGEFSVYPARFALRFKPGVGLKDIVSDVSNQFIK